MTNPGENPIMNIVQFVEGPYMNTVITSKESILNVSQELIKSQGWTAVNIRAVAAECGISVGSVYNYFHSKSDLLSAVVESVWCDIFHFPESRSTFDDFVSCLEWIFDCMKEGNVKYPGFFTLHSMSFLEEDKSNGKLLMAQSWKHIQNGLHTVLKNDKNVRQDAFDQVFTCEEFIHIIFSFILSALLQQNYDCSAILEMTRRLLY